LRTLAQHAFRLSLDHHVIEPEEHLRITTLPDKTCIAVLMYPGHPGGRLELQAPVLAFFPAAYLINVRFVNYQGTLASGFLGEHWPDTISFVQGAPPPASSPSAWADASGTNAFKMQLGTAWVHTNWLLLCAVLLLTQPAGRILILLSAPVLAWLLLCFFWVLHSLLFPWRIPEPALCVPFIFLCWRAARHSREVIGLTVGAWATGILNAVYDIQHIAPEDFGQSVAVVTEYGLGFIVSLATVFLILTPLILECKKHAAFQTHWTPALCWLAAILSLLLPLEDIRLP
jgi:hypothetical protein